MGAFQESVHTTGHPGTELELSRIWNDYIKPGNLTEINEEKSRSEQKKQKDKLKEQLKSKTEELAEDENLIKTISGEIGKIWEDQDSIIRGKIRDVKKWMLPQRKNPGENSEITSIGGLSLTRRSPIQNAYRVMNGGFFRFSYFFDSV